MLYKDPNGRGTVESSPMIKIIVYEGQALKGLERAAEDLETLRAEAVAELFTQILITDAAGKAVETQKYGESVIVSFTDARKNLPADLPLEVNFSSGAFVWYDRMFGSETKGSYSQNKFVEFEGRNFWDFMAKVEEISPELRRRQTHHRVSIDEVTFVDVVTVSVQKPRSLKTLANIRINLSPKYSLRDSRLGSWVSSLGKNDVIVDKETLEPLCVKQNDVLVPINEYRAQVALQMQAAKGAPTPV